MNEDQVGSTSSGPTFPRYGERWFECWICGFDYPEHESRRHYRSHRLVCKDCDDEKTHFDYLAEIAIPSEAEAARREPLEQVATCQNEISGSRWYEARWYEGKFYDPGDQDCSGARMATVGQPKNRGWDTAGWDQDFWSE